VSEELILGDPRISILEGVILPWGEPSGYLRKIVLPALARQLKFDLNAPWGALPKSVRDAILYGTTKDSRGKRSGATSDAPEWEGVLNNIERRYEESDSDTIRLELQEFMIEVPCDECDGRRLKREALSVTVQNKSIGEVVEWRSSRRSGFSRAFDSSGRPPGLDPRSRADSQGSA
jgi:excinuclease ABC subunit A